MLAIVTFRGPSLGTLALMFAIGALLLQTLVLNCILGHLQSRTLMLLPHPEKQVPSNIPFAFPRKTFMPWVLKLKQKVWSVFAFLNTGLIPCMLLLALLDTGA